MIDYLRKAFFFLSEHPTRLAGIHPTSKVEPAVTHIRVWFLLKTLLLISSCQLHLSSDSSNYPTKTYRITIYISLYTYAISDGLAHDGDRRQETKVPAAKCGAVGG